MNRGAIFQPNGSRAANDEIPFGGHDAGEIVEGKGSSLHADSFGQGPGTPIDDARRKNQGAKTEGFQGDIAREPQIHAASIGSARGNLGGFEFEPTSAQDNAPPARGQKRVAGGHKASGAQADGGLVAQGVAPGAIGSDVEGNPNRGVARRREADGPPGQNDSPFAHGNGSPHSAHRFALGHVKVIGCRAKPSIDANLRGVARDGWIRPGKQVRGGRSRAAGAGSPRCIDIGCSKFAVGELQAIGRAGREGPDRTGDIDGTRWTKHHAIGIEHDQIGAASVRFGHPRPHQPVDLRNRAAGHPGDDSIESNRGAVRVSDAPAEVVEGGDFALSDAELVEAVEQVLAPGGSHLQFDEIVGMDILRVGSGSNRQAATGPHAVVAHDETLIGRGGARPRDGQRQQDGEQGDRSAHWDFLESLSFRARAGKPRCRAVRSRAECITPFPASVPTVHAARKPTGVC